MSESNLIPQWLSRLINGNKSNSPLVFSPDQPSVFKALGRGLWLAAYTNNFEDREQEILSKTSHDKYLLRVKLGIVPAPELWHWHLPGTAHGKALWVDRIGEHIIYAIGEFSDDEAGRIAEKHYLESGINYELSHGFTFPTWARSKEGVYEEYNTFEITTLPSDLTMAANPYTVFTEIKDMALTSDKKKSLRRLFGDQADDVIARVESLESLGEKIVESGARYKDFASKANEPVEDEEKIDAEDEEEIIEDVVEAVEDDEEKLDEEGADTFDILLEGQTFMMEMLDELSSAMSGLASALTAMEKDNKSIKRRLALTPRSVKSLDEDEKEEDDILPDDAEEEVKQQINGDESFDPMFPGMKVSAPSRKRS